MGEHHHHDHGHSHHGHHHHIDPESGDRQVAAAVGVNLLLTLAQFVGGVLSGSIALIADAVHNLSDALSLGIAFFARRLGRRPGDARMTFGYARAEVVAALVNYTTLIVIGLYLVYEGIQRLFDPPSVTGWLVLAVAGIALAVDVATALLTLRLSRDSVNIRAAFLHNLSDALASVAVIVAGVLILLYDWWLVDPLVTLGIAGYILWMSVAEIGPVIRILMLGAPPDIDREAVRADLAAAAGIEEVHHLHVWQFDENRASLEAHLVVSEAAARSDPELKARLKAMLADRYGLRHATLEVETRASGCADVAAE